MTNTGRSDDQYRFVFAARGIAVERILIGAEKSYGEKAILSAVAVFPLLYDKMQYAPDGSTIGRVLRFAFCRGVGRDVV